MVNYKTGEFPILDDIAFKETFGRKERVEYSEYFLECYHELPIGSLKGKVNVLLDETLEKNHLGEHGYILDVVMIYNDVIYNVEAYRKFDTTALYKTIAYGDKIFSSELNRGESYQKIKKVEQIVIVGHVKIDLEKNFKTTNCFRSERKLLTDIQKLTILRVDKVGRCNYNEDNKEARLVELIRFIGASNQKMRDELAKKGSKEIMKLNEFEKKFSEEIVIPLGYDRDEFHYAQGIEEGMNLGMERGMERGMEQTALKMLKENCDEDFISKITGLSKKEIKRLQKENQNMNIQVA